MRRGLVIWAVTVPLLLAAGVARAAPLDPECSFPAGYPGDSASREAIAGWMAHRAKERAIPPELPVMAALAESGLQNLDSAGGDRAGYFRMQRSVWDHGPYAGFPSNPELQLSWFIDSAVAARTHRVDGGDTSFGQAEQGWGAWIADVLQPPEHLRGQYQPRLEEARALIVKRCSLPGGRSPEGEGAGPAIGFAIRASQRVVRLRGVVVRVSCPAEACLTRALVRFSIPGEARVYRVGSRFVGLTRGETVRVRVPFRPTLLRKVRRALRRGVRLRAKLTVAVLDNSGNGVSRVSRVRFH